MRVMRTPKSDIRQRGNSWKYRSCMLYYQRIEDPQSLGTYKMDLEHMILSTIQNRSYSSYNVKRMIISLEIGSGEIRAVKDRKRNIIGLQVLLLLIAFI